MPPSLRSACFGTTFVTHKPVCPASRLPFYTSSSIEELQAHVSWARIHFRFERYATSTALALRPAPFSVEQLDEVIANDLLHHLGHLCQRHCKIALQRSGNCPSKITLYRCLPLTSIHAGPKSPMLNG